MSYTDFGRLQRLQGVAGGAVCFAGTGVMVSVVASRFLGGEPIDDLAEDYRLSRQTIEAGLRLLLTVNGTSLESKRARAKVSEYIPLLRNR